MVERLLTANEFESLVKEVGLSMAEVCRRSGVAQSTFHRWKTGASGLTVSSYMKLIEALDAQSVPQEPT